MRISHTLTAIAAFTAGLSAATALRQRADRRVPVPAAVTTTNLPAVERVSERDGVVLPFLRPVVPAPAELESPARCGDTGGRTKAGAPCGSRITVGGRCHHHPIAA